MHKYKVFEVFHDGTLFDTKKNVDEPSNSTLQRSVLSLYGFTDPRYDYMFAVEYDGGNINISYNFGNSIGNKKVWHLKRGH